MNNVAAKAIACVLASACQAEPSARDPQVESEKACHNLADTTYVGATLISAEHMVAGTKAAAFQDYEPETILPEHCLIKGSFGKRTGYDGKSFEIRFELRMPTEWNGRFLFEGGGYMDGVDWPAYGTLFGMLSPNALDRGFAVVRTNSGHDSPNGNAIDGAFSYDQQAKLDYAFNALEKVTLSAKKIVSTYYGKTPEHSYFAGCSNGGRQAMLVSQRYPDYFDGVVSGDPSFNISRLSPRLVWNINVLAEIAPKDSNGNPIISKSYSDSDLKFIADAVRKKCDPLDGLEDGVINDIAGCTFDPTSLVCKGAKSDRCITAGQASTLTKIMTGPLNPNGEPLYQPLPYDTGLDGSWRFTFLGTSATSNGDSFIETAGLHTLRYHSLTPPDPDFDPKTMNLANTLERIRETQALNDAEATLMNAFAEGSKLIIYNGVSDFALSVFELAEWYDNTDQATPGDIQEWARMFFVPGMGHCGGGIATDKFDPLSAIIDWVEGGNAPDYLAAQGDRFPGATRPVCAWPKVARYKGGPPAELNSFTCE